MELLYGILFIIRTCCSIGCPLLSCGQYCLSSYQCYHCLKLCPHLFTTFRIPSLASLWMCWKDEEFLSLQYLSSLSPSSGETRLFSSTHLYSTAQTGQNSCNSRNTRCRSLFQPPAGKRDADSVKSFLFIQHPHAVLLWRVSEPTQQPSREHIVVCLEDM